MLKVLITGGSGLLGNSLVSILRDRFTIYSIAKKGKYKTVYKNVNYINLDLTSKECVPFISNLKLDVIIHCAALIPGGVDISQENIKEINSSIDENIISISSKLNCYLIFMSSTIVYGYSNNTFNIKEDIALKAISSYAVQKIESEKLIMNKINRFLILRINAPYGQPKPNKTVLTIFCQQAIQNKTLFYHGTGTRMQDFTHINDISNLIYSLLKSQSFINGVFNISYGKPISMMNLAKLIVQTAESNSEIRASGLIDLEEEYKADYSIEKAKIQLGWEPKITLKNGISELIKIMKKC
ncbi:MAG: UDP-glucose 4-epimerase [Planctomycetota bacterium]|jgi:UDP-glucose 4-epimerase